MHRFATLLLAAFALTLPALADDAKAPATQEEVRILAEEVRRLKLEIGIPDAEYRSFAGLGPAASKVYFVQKGLSLGGYGEFTYQNYTDSRADESDIRRVVLYAGYRFSPLVVFNAEIEFEHGAKEIGVEFAYLDLLFSDALRLRVGNLLVPMGIVNEMHEPPFFNGVNRPEPERNLIPATWHENGIGLHGERGALRYKAYLLTGLDPIGNGAAAGSWMRGGRGGAGEARANSVAGVLALGYDLGPAAVGASLYYGWAGQGRKAADGSVIDAPVLIAEAHCTAAWRGLQAKALLVHGSLGDAAAVSEALSLSGEGVLASRVLGGYAELGYDVLPLLAATDQAAVLFARYEYQDLHAAVPAGGQRNPALESDGVVAGVTYKPLPNVALKADYQWKRSKAPGATALDQVNLGAGFVF